ncbi:hypothetical protein [Micromonospora endolithica]|uniref:Uncharacterized protein n=1 Tax=Micromonospora endolithica TaxID=230091 RepID=A0A3A9ZQ78_9ACTN|nr:hypothetical protein [Micromonospora endolithica]RKN50331.1 hypothetical protein D7223_00500 [Micromonospora endolithica]TWJ21008.1 hypothetical protein JD76_01108 [Micromonospora endolithica]
MVRPRYCAEAADCGCAVKGTNLAGACTLIEKLGEVLLLALGGVSRGSHIVSFSGARAPLITVVHNGVPFPVQVEANTPAGLV